MKRLKVLILVLCLTFICNSCVASEDAVVPIMIAAPEGTRTAMRITAEDNKEIAILGVESEPIAQSWNNFSTTFSAFVKNNWRVDLSFSYAIWSGGEWLHVLDAGSVCIRVFTTDCTNESRIVKVLLTGEPDCMGDVQMLAAAAYWSAAQYGETGMSAMSIVFMEDHSNDWFDSEPISVWLENGYLLQYGMNNEGYPYGEISFTEDMEIMGGYNPFDPNGLPNLQTELTTDALLSGIKQLAENRLAGSGITAFSLPDAWQNAFSSRVYQIVWDDCALIICTDSDGKYIQTLTLSDMNGDTGNLCLHLYILYNAVVDTKEDMLSLLPCITGGHGTWETMSALSPYCVINNIMLQCETYEIGKTDIHIAYICGAIARE